MADGDVYAVCVHGGLARVVPAQGRLPLAAAQTLCQCAACQQLAGYGAPAVVLPGDVAHPAAARLVHHGHGLGHRLLIQPADIVPKQLHLSCSSLSYFFMR